MFGFSDKFRIIRTRVTGEGGARDLTKPGPVFIVGQRKRLHPIKTTKFGVNSMNLPFPGRLLALAVFSTLSLALPLSAAHAEDKPKVALVMKSLANEFFLTMEDGAKAYQKDHANDFDLVANGIK